MEKQNMVLEEAYTIDLLHILKVLWKKAWLLAICGVIAGVIGFCVSAFGIAPTYSSTIKLYANNNSLSLGNTSFSLTTGDISASRSLVATYGEILNNRTTLERVLERAESSYSYKKLSGMINFGSSNNTEIMFVTVTAGDPYEASLLANCISEVLPERISEIIKGATMEVVDSAIPVLEKVSPSISKYTVLGFMLGLILCAAVIVVLSILDDTIHDEEHIINTYEYPILARIPDLLSKSSQKYGYYYKSKNESED